MTGAPVFDQMVAFLKTMEGKTMSPRIKPPVGRPGKVDQNGQEPK